MKTILFISIFLFAMVEFSFCKSDSSKAIISADTTATDSIEYELIVFDLGFDSYLVTQPPMEFYSESYYKNWNFKYVTEWNNRYYSQAQTGLYETYIDYDYNIDYGIELEYQLYYYFQFFEKTNHLQLIPRGKD